MSERLTTKQNDLLLLLLDVDENPVGRSIDEVVTDYREMLPELEDESWPERRRPIIGYDHHGVRQTLLSMATRGWVRREQRARPATRRGAYVFWWITEEGYQALWGPAAGQKERNPDG